MTFRALPPQPDLAPADTALEPLRFLAGGASELERRLLHSARLDRVPAAAAARVASRFGVEQELARVQPPSMTPATAPPPSLRSPLSCWSRLGSLGGVGGLAALAGLGLIGALTGRGTESSHGAAPDLPAPHVARAPAVTQTTRAFAAGLAHDGSPAALPGLADPHPVSATLPAAREALAPASSSARSGARSRAPHSSAPAAAAPAEKPPAAGLIAELRALEAVQTALRERRIAEAQRLLAAYAAAFPAGELGLEAELLRIDLALGRGEHERALALARAFERRPGAARYRERLAALLSGARPSASQDDSVDRTQAASTLGSGDKNP